MAVTEEVVYEDVSFIHDIVKLRHDLFTINSGFVETYLSDNFEEECSRDYQRHKMWKLPFFATKILEDYDYSSEEEKQDVFLNSLVYSDKGQGRIVLVDGSMGGGKTGFGCWVADAVHERNENLNYFFVTKSTTHPALPKWFKIVDSIEKVESSTAKSKYDSFALIDEGAIQLSSRRAMHGENKDASEMLVKLRQKGITMVILVQHVKMVDVNVRRLANLRCLKYGIDFGSDDNSSDDMKELRRRLRPRSNREVYIENPTKNIFLRFQHGLPEWWDDEKVSKYMKKWDKSKGVKKQEKEASIVDAI